MGVLTCHHTSSYIKVSDLHHWNHSTTTTAPVGGNLTGDLTGDSAPIVNDSCQDSVGSYIGNALYHTTSKQVIPDKVKVGVVRVGVGVGYVRASVR